MWANIFSLTVCLFFIFLFSYYAKKCYSEMTKLNQEYKKIIANENNKYSPAFVERKKVERETKTDLYSLLSTLCIGFLIIIIVNIFIVFWILFLYAC